MSFGLWFSRGLALLLALALGWQVITLNMADHYTDIAGAGNSDALETALWWRATQPDALARRGLAAVREGQPASAEDYLRRAVAANPADARPLVDLALLNATGEKVGAGDRLAETAHQLMPVQYAAQRDLAMYWFARQQYTRAVQHLAVALVGGDQDLREEYFPVLLDIASRPDLRPTLKPVTDNPEPYNWWPGFFRYTANTVEDVAVLSALVAMRESSTVSPLAESERAQYTNRLRKEGMIAEAYLYWVNGLSQEQLQYLGYLYDGSFEMEFGNASGFGWVARPPNNSGIRVAIAETYGADGEQALRASFRGKRLRFSHLWQNLFLAPGNYVLYGRVRPDKLQARRGLAWRVHCSAGAQAMLGESEYFSGTGDWRDFEMRFAVPAGCNGQVLRLQSVGSRDVDHEVLGNIWFDAMHIELDREGGA